MRGRKKTKLELPQTLQNDIRETAQRCGASPQEWLEIALRNAIEASTLSAEGLRQHLTVEGAFAGPNSEIQAQELAWKTLPNNQHPCAYLLPAIPPWLVNSECQGSCKLLARVCFWHKMQAVKCPSFKPHLNLFHS